MVDYQPGSTFPRSSSEAALGSSFQPPPLTFMEDYSRSSYAAVHEDARRTAALRIAWWRGEQRRQRQEEKRQQTPPWFKAREASASALRVQLWAKEACEKAAPPRTLITTTTTTTLSSSASPGRKQRATPAAAEEVLQQKLAAFSSLLARLKRFALLNEEVQMVGVGMSVAGGGESPMRTSTMLREAAGLDEARNLLADLLCALRTSMTAVVEAVQACTNEQHGDDFLNLNLPAVRRAFPAAAGQPTGQPPGQSAGQPANPGGGGGGFSGFSASRHSRILCGMVEQVAAFIPLPFAHDPLLLKWFDEHAEIWQSMLSMQAVKAAKSVQHGVTDRKRMEAAQQVLSAALEGHGANLPHVLPPDTQWDAFPRHVIGATAAAMAPIPSPVPPPGPLSASRLPTRGTTPGSAPGSADGLPLPRRFAPSPSAPSLLSPSAALPAALPAVPFRPGAVGSGNRPPSVSVLSAAGGGSGGSGGGGGGGGGGGCGSSRLGSPPSRTLMSASPSNLAPDTELPPDPREEARRRAEARARALWTGLELLVYGEPGLYAEALKRMFLKLEEDAKNRKLAAHAVMVVAVGGQLDEETVVQMAVRSLQRVWRKRRQKKLEQIRSRAEHSATIAILGEWRLERGACVYARPFPHAHFLPIASYPSPAHPLSYAAVPGLPPSLARP